jgi:hypothetical protein
MGDVHRPGDDVPRPGPVPAYGTPDSAGRPEPVPAYGTPDSAGRPEPVPAYGTPDSAGRPEPVPAYGTPDSDRPPPAPAYGTPEAADRPPPIPVYGTSDAAYVVQSGAGTVRRALGSRVPRLRHLLDAGRSVVCFAVDAYGVRFRGATNASGATCTLLVPWESIATLTYFQVEQPSTDGDAPVTGNDAVGVTLTAEAGGDPGALAYHQVFTDQRLDPGALRAAVHRYGGVPVLTGPSVGHASVSELPTVIGDFLRGHRSTEPEGRPGSA